MAAEQQQSVAKAGSSRFAMTCGLLRQYMKEQGGTGAAVRCLAPAMALSLTPEPTAPEPEPEEGGKTMLELFPQQAGTLKASRERKEPESRRAPLTIFYGGRMVVFDDFPAEKAEELMKAAGSGNVSPTPAAAGQPACLPDMPIARKVSLQRFLAKRKDRLATGDPEPAAVSVVADSNKRLKDDGAPPCLGGGVNPVLSLN